ncbi:carbohydrate binding domain protein [Escherichia coli 88.0221]|nr:carbohydrate binding domain protein [Escherichia coli 88.0221]
MTERELSIIRALGEEFAMVLADLQRTFEEKIAAQAQTFEEKLASQSVVLQKCVTGDDVRPMLEQMVKEAVSHIPVPRDGRDYDPDVLQKAVNDAVSALPAPQDGRDATALEILPAIDDQKSFPRGSYATHQGGLWRAYEKTYGMRGWECLVDGVADIDVSMTGERLFSVVVRQSSGQRTEKTFSLPVMLYRGVFRIGETYHPGDTVTWGGSLWHCNSMTGDKPGEAHSSGWTLAAKRGRDAGGGK